MTMAASAGHVSEQRCQKDQRQESKDRRDQVGDLAVGSCGRGHRSLRQASNNEKSAEKSAQNVRRSVRNQRGARYVKHGLQRVERTGADVAKHHAKGGQAQGWHAGVAYEGLRCFARLVGHGVLFRLDQ